MRECSAHMQERVWLLLHNSDYDQKHSAAVRLYLDESGTGGRDNPTAVVGGIIINRSDCDHFESEWFTILKRHDVEPPLHMREFRRGRKLAGLRKQQRGALFAELVPLINSLKIASVSATLSNCEYEEHCPVEMRDKFSVYGMCFILAAEMNDRLAEGRYEGRIPFILDTGNPHTD